MNPKVSISGVQRSGVALRSTAAAAWGFCGEENQGEAHLLRWLDFPVALCVP